MADYVHARIPDMQGAICGQAGVRTSEDDKKVNCPRCQIIPTGLAFRTVPIWGGLNFFNELWHRATGETLCSSTLFLNRRAALDNLDGMLAQALENPYIREKLNDKISRDWFE